jgi:uncharacterized membrane protein YbhN (UPF0104 family)
VPIPPSADLGASFHSFFRALDKFFSNLAAVDWRWLLVALMFFAGYLLLRSRAIFNALRAAYPSEDFEWRRIWGAYVAAVGFKNVIPGGAANIIQVFLTRASIERSTLPTVAAGVGVATIFDVVMSVLAMLFAFTQGVFPKPPDFAKLNAFDLEYFASHPEFTLFLLTALGVLAVVAFAVLSVRVKAFWARVRQGFTVLRDRRRYVREVVAWQAASWICRLTAFFFMLEAFHVGGSVRNALLVQGVQIVSTIVPLTPGGAGVQQALLVTVFAGSASTSTVAAYSVGQQLALAAFALILGFVALAAIFRIRSFREVVRQARAQRTAEAAG